MEIEAGCSGLSVAACHLSSQNPHGELSREAYSAKSSLRERAPRLPAVFKSLTPIEHLASLAPTLGGALPSTPRGRESIKSRATQLPSCTVSKLACMPGHILLVHPERPHQSLTRVERG